MMRSRSSLTHETSAAMMSGWLTSRTKLRQSDLRMDHCRASRMGRAKARRAGLAACVEAGGAWRARLPAAAGRSAEGALPLLGRAIREAVVEAGELLHAEVFARGLGGALEGEAAADEHDQLVHEVGVLHHVRGADDGAAGVREVAEQFHELEFRGRDRGRSWAHRGREWRAWRATRRRRSRACAGRRRAG